jgi:hypothetical protein
MPHLVWIPGCGQMTSSSYREVTAALDRIFAQPEDQPLRVADAFAELATKATKVAQSEPEP